LLERPAALAAREAGGISVLDRLLREANGNEALLEDASTSLLRMVQEDEQAGETLVELGTMKTIVEHLENPNEELQVRMCGLIYGCCEQVPVVRTELHRMGAIHKILPLLSSSAEEVQEAAARAIEKFSRLPPVAVAVRRADGIQQLVDLLASKDTDVKVAVVCAIMNVVGSDLKAAAAIRDADGLQRLVDFLGSDDKRLHTPAANALINCARNETNKTLLREMGAIEALLRLCSREFHRDAQAAAVSCLANLMQNEDEARVRLRLRGGLKKLQALLCTNDLTIQARTAETLFHCAPNVETRIALRLADCLQALISLLSSPSSAARLASAGALMQATQNTSTNQIKCRELGAIVPLLYLLENDNERNPDIECQRRAVWCLSNIVCEPLAAKQLRQTPSGLRPLFNLLGGKDGEAPIPGLQRPAVSCLFNASTTDLGAPEGVLACGGLEPLVRALHYAETRSEKEIVASSAGVLLNCAMRPDFAKALVSTHPEVLARLLTCIEPGGDVLQNSYACGALQNISANVNEAAREILEQGGLPKLLEIISTSSDEPIVCCHAAGALSNLLFSEEARDALCDCKASDGRNGIKVLVEALEGAEIDDQTASLCMALLNACHKHDRSREECVDCGGINALVACLAQDSYEVRAAASGALLNATCASSCAEAVRETSIETEEKRKKVSVTGYELLVRLLTADQPVLRARGAGALFNCAAFGPENRIEMKTQGVIKAVIAALNKDALGAPKSASADVAFKIQGYLIGILLNTSLNPTCKAEIINCGGIEPILRAVASDSDSVQFTASTALAYVNDKSELRPGSPNSTLHSMEDPARLTHTKMRFHESSGAAASSSVALDALEDTPGARTKAQFGTIPVSKISATHDSATKGPRMVQEDPQKYSRRVPECISANSEDDDYEEIPSPLPSPVESDAE